MIDSIVWNDENYERSGVCGKAAMALQLIRVTNRSFYNLISIDTVAEHIAEYSIVGFFCGITVKCWIIHQMQHLQGVARECSWFDLDSF